MQEQQPTVPAQCDNCGQFTDYWPLEFEIVNLTICEDCLEEAILNRNTKRWMPDEAGL